MSIKIGDLVQVTKGKDKGKTGKVLRMVRNKDDRKLIEKVYVEGLNMKTKYLKKTEGRAGQMLKIEGAIPRANVGVFCPETKKATRVGHKVEDGKKVRFSKRSGKVIK